MPGCWYRPKLSNVDPRQGRDVGTFGGGRGKELPGNRRGELHTSSTDEAFKSSFYAMRIPNRTNGRASDQYSSAWHMRAAFS
jgi:hypothetical protein